MRIGRPGKFGQRFGAGILLAILAVGGGGCSAQPLSENPGVKGVTDKLNITTNVPPPADFVAKSRPQSLEYMPVGVVPPARGGPAPRKPDQVKALEAEMEGTRARHDRLGGRKPPVTAAKAKPGDKPKPKPAAPL